MDLGHDFESAVLFMHGIETAIRHGAKFEVFDVSFSCRGEVMVVRVHGVIGGKSVNMSQLIPALEVASCKTDSVRPHVDRILSEMNALAGKQRAKDAKEHARELERGGG